jgi:inner membrane protein
LLVLPPLLAWALLRFDRWQARRGIRPPGRAPVAPGQLLLLCYIGAISHPLLDLMNTYGIRFLMPFSDRWFYGDTQFIADPWIWLALGAGIWLSRRRETHDRANIAAPAIVALLGVTFYTGAMAVAGRAAETRVARQFRASGLGEPQQVVASPVFADPFRRRMIVRSGDRYGFGDFSWLPGPQLALDPDLVPTNMNNPAIPTAAARDKKVADFLYWSRLPLAVIQPVPDGTRVTIGDARFGNRADDGIFGVTATIP